MHVLEVPRPERGRGEDLHDVGPRFPCRQDLGRREGAGHRGHVVTMADADHLRPEDGPDDVARTGQDGQSRGLRVENGPGPEEEPGGQGRRDLAR